MPDQALPARPSSRPPITPSSSRGRTNSFAAGHLPAKASPVPLLVGAVAVIGSLALAVAEYFDSTPTLLFAQPRIELPLAQSSVWWLSLIGYILTPIVVILARGWDAVSQRRGLQNRNFELKPLYSSTLQVLVVVGFIVALWQLLNLSLPVAGLVAPGSV